MGNRVQGKPRQEGDKGSSSGAVSGNDLEAALQPTDLDFKVHSTDITVDIQILCERQQEVQELADEYARVYNTFADLQDLGALQAEQCQDIEFDPAVNVDAAVERTKQGMEHLEAALKTQQQQTRKRLICCAVVFVILVAAVVALTLLLK